LRLERDEVNGLKLLQRQQQADGIKAAYVFINERDQPFAHSAGYALAARGIDTRRLQHFLGHASITNTVRYTAMSPKPFKDIWR
jgi:site-specific recombinase XerD